MSDDVRLSLHVGMLPAPELIAGAFESLTVTYSDAGMSSGWQIVFRSRKTHGLTQEYELILKVLKPFVRVSAGVHLGAGSRVLLDGVITHFELSPAQAGNDGTLTITGDSLETLMDREEKSRAMPGQTPSEIAESVLAHYLSNRVTPEVVPPEPPSVPAAPETFTQIQNETDAQFLRRLASLNGAIFRVAPHPSTIGTSIAYWGPSRRTSVPQKALSVDLGPETNVNSLSFSFDASMPTRVSGGVQDEYQEGPEEDPVESVPPIGLPLATSPAIAGPHVYKKQYSNPAFEPQQALAEASSIEKRSAQLAVTATGSLDTLRYGAVLSANGIVGVRGAGHTYDGDYYVNSVTHTLRSGTYTQDFSLSREGTGSTTPMVRP